MLFIGWFLLDLGLQLLRLRDKIIGAKKYKRVLESVSVCVKLTLCISIGICISFAVWKGSVLELLQPIKM